MISKSTGNAHPFARAWEGIEAVYCITIDTATHRHAIVKQTLADVGLADKTRLLVNKRDPQGGVRGCFESHRAAWERARVEGLNNVLIVEDDVFFSKDWFTYLPYALQFMRENRDWDLLFLGWTPYKSFRTQWDHVTRMGCGTATHAYILSRRGMEKGIAPYDTVRRAIDVHLMCPQCEEGTWRRPFASCSHDTSTQVYENYGLQPMIAFQRYDKTSSTGDKDWTNRRKARVGLMRFFGNTCSTVAMPTLVLIISVLVLMVIGAIVWGCVATSRKSK